MTYLWLASGFVGVAAVVGLVLGGVGGGRSGSGEALAARRDHWSAVALALAALLVLTIVFDNLMIGLELFHYDTEHLAGLHIGLAPVEDLAYPLACALALPGLWRLLTRRREGARDA